MNSVGNIGKRIELALTKKGITRTQLCEKTGLTKAALSRYISGNREPRSVTISQIADALDMSVDELLGNKKPHKNEDLHYAIELVARRAKDLTDEDKTLLFNAIAGIK